MFETLIGGGNFVPPPPPPAPVSDELREYLLAQYATNHPEPEPEPETTDPATLLFELLGIK